LTNTQKDIWSFTILDIINPQKGYDLIYRILFAVTIIQHRGIVINRINEPFTSTETKLMACKLLRKCCKEEAPTWVITVVTQCTKWTLLSLNPSLVNLFLDDSKDEQDLGTNFHYLWLIILVALVGWRHPKFNMFFQRIGNYWVSEYVTFWHTSNTK
jgi:hypothetical protein